MRIAQLLSLFTLLQLASAADEKLNVLFVISDDLNYMLSHSGHAECQTPYLDAFAQQAVSFSRAYCQYPICGPSRASIMSGQYPFANGVVKNGSYLPESCVTLPKHFADHGYWTARVSKIYHMGIPGDIVQGTAGTDHAPSWHAAHNIAALETMTPGRIRDYDKPATPAVYPVERSRWSAAQRGEITNYTAPASARGQWSVVEVADADTGLLVDTIAADQAIDILRQRSSGSADPEQRQPFFLAVGFVRPHFPFIATESTIAPYDVEQIAYPAMPDDDYDDIPKAAINSRREDLSEEAVRQLRRGYYGAVTYMDEQFGRLMAELDRLQLREKTIVVFVSDHGYMLGEHQMWKKHKFWEEAIHVPLLIDAPGATDATAGEVCDSYVELVDLYPTLAELAGLPESPSTQGLSLAGLLQDTTTSHPSRGDALIQTTGGNCLRSGQWAYMHFPKNKKKKSPAAAMLFDMEADPQQFHNLAENPEHAQTVERLHQRLMERVTEAKATQ